MNKYDSLLKPKKTKLVGIDAEKRKILKQIEADNPSLAKNRRDAIEFLEKVTGSMSGRKGKKGKSQKSAKGDRGEASNSNNGSATTGSGGTPLFDYEKLFADIAVVIEKHLDDQEDLATKLTEAVEDIFKRHGLLMTA